MTHSHATDHPTTAESSVRQLKALRLMMLILIPIAIWTVVGLIWLWPHDVSSHIREDTSTYSAKGVTLPKAEITQVERTSCQGQVGSVPGAADQKACGNITAKLLEGPEQGQEVQVVLTEAQFRSGVEIGQKVKLVRVPPGTQAKAQASYQFSDFDRTVPLVALAVAFALVVIVIARWRGFASLIGLGFAAFILIKFLFPAIVSGANPLLAGLVGSVAIMFVVLYTAHGFSARTTTALLGTLFGLLVTAGLGWAMTSWAHLTGIAAEDDYLLAASAPDMTLTSVVLCGVIIAGLGVLNDVTITQASAVWELAESDPDQKKLFTRAMRIGRDHIASSVYTIAFATAGAGLATLLLITVYSRPLSEVAQTEALSQEIIRTLVGAIGLVLAMPLTTAVGVAVVAAGRIGRKSGASGASGVSGDDDQDGRAAGAAAGDQEGALASSRTASSGGTASGGTTASSGRKGRARTKPAKKTPAGGQARKQAKTGGDSADADTLDPDVQRVRPTAATTAPLDERETTRLPRIRRDDPSAAPPADPASDDTETRNRSRRGRHDDEDFNFSDLRPDDEEDEEPRGRRWR